MKTKLPIALFLLAALAGCKNAGEHHNEAVLPTAGISTEQQKLADSLNDAAYAQYDRSYPSSLQLAYAAENIARKTNYIKGLADSRCIISLVQSCRNDGKVAIDSIHQLLPAVINARDTVSAGRLYAALGACRYRRSEYDSARKYYEKGWAMLGSAPIDRVLCGIGLAKVLLKTGNQPKATLYYEQAAAYKGVRDTMVHAWANALMGELYYSQRLYDKAIAYYKESDARFKDFDNYNGIGATELQLGNTYYMQMEDDSARQSYIQALDAYTALGDYNGMAIIYSNLSRIYLEHDKIKEAIASAQEALNIIGRDNYATIEAGTYQQLGDIYGQLAKYDSAIIYVQKAMQVARASGNKTIVKDCYKSLSEIYSAMKRPAAAFDNLLAAYRIKDSIQPVSFNKQLADMEAKYETVQKEAEIKLLKQQQQIDQLKQAEQQHYINKQRLILITLVLLLISGAIGLYLYITRRRLKECVMKQSLIRETESAERRRIAKDIHDELGSGLSKIKFLSELMYTQAGNKQQLDASLQSISETCKNVIDNMRDLVWAMNPENTTLANLVARIREYSGEYLEEFPIDIVYDIPEDIPQTRITKEMSRNIYMIVKEALQNVVKHSKADKVSLVMQLHPHFQLQIADNGTGDINESRKDGNGLKNMESRSKAIGADLNIIAIPGKGTSIELKTNISPVNSTT